MNAPIWGHMPARKIRVGDNESQQVVTFCIIHVVIKGNKRVSDNNITYPKQIDF